MSGQLQYECEWLEKERKYMNSDKAQWKEPELGTLITKLGGGTNVQRKQTYVHQELGPTGIGLRAILQKRENLWAISN